MISVMITATISADRGRVLAFRLGDRLVVGLERGSQLPPRHQHREEYQQVAPEFQAAHPPIIRAGCFG